MSDWGFRKIRIGHFLDELLTFLSTKLHGFQYNSEDYRIVQKDDQKNHADAPSLSIDFSSTST